METKFSKSDVELQEIALNGNKETVNDLYQVDPKLLVVEIDHNVRNFEDDNVKAHIEWLKTDIKKNSIITPLLCRRHKKVGVYVNPSNGKEYDLWSWSVIDGECRKRAIDELLAEGCDIKRVPVISERQNSNDADRALYMLKSNEGLAFTKYERAKLYQRFMNFGWTKEEIAEKVSRSLNHVNECLGLLNYSDQVQKLLVDKKITANNVIAIEKQVKKDVSDGKIKKPTNRYAEVEQRLAQMMRKAEDASNEGGRIVKVGKIINVKKTESEELAEQLDAVLNALPRKPSYTLAELEELYDLLSAGHPVKNSINSVFGSKVEAATGTEG